MRRPAGHQTWKVEGAGQGALRQHGVKTRDRRDLIDALMTLGEALKLCVTRSCT
ncbi:hypothetical protein BaRGS_00030615, partial [Batillaria attramentaria]